MKRLRKLKFVQGRIRDQAGSEQDTMQQITIYVSLFDFKTVFARSLFDRKKLYFHQTFQLMSAVVK
jgi:hypothetical protein